MIDEAKLQKIINVFAQYNIEIEAHEMVITRINQRTVEFDATKYMTDQLIKLITEVLADEVNKEVWGLLR